MTAAVLSDSHIMLSAVVLTAAVLTSTVLSAAIFVFNSARYLICRCNY